ncbi:MAG: iron-sulfur cluster assembly accessory protein [Candidatus Diapherotrites archaeon]|nr:iron-sulfur cluster assembly accessory protein [Candidatus Diapherotrites archaeon]
MSESKTTQELVTRDMAIGEVVAKYPQTAQVMERFGLHCIGCHVNQYESLAQGAMGHGMEEDVFEEMLEQVNKAASMPMPEHSETETTGHPGENGEKIKGVLLTETAAKKFAEFREKEGKTSEYSLRVAAMPGGCAGFTYRLVFDKPRDDDLVFEHHGVKVLVSEEQVHMLNGTKIDYIDSLEGSGFKIDNPSSTASCGCGKSFH